MKLVKNQTDILIQEFQREKETEEVDSEEEKELDKFGMMTQLKRTISKRKKKSQYLN